MTFHDAFLPYYEDPNAPRVPISPAKSRWVRCPHCRCPAEQLATALHCTGEECKWFDANAFREWMREDSPLP